MLIHDLIFFNAWIKDWAKDFCNEINLLDEKMLSNSIMHGFVLYDFASRTLLLHRINYKMLGMHVSFVSSMAWENLFWSCININLFKLIFSNKNWLCGDFFQCYCIRVWSWKNCNTISVLNYIWFWKNCFGYMKNCLLLHGTMERLSYFFHVCI